jgi:hypothetical protein
MQPNQQQTGEPQQPLAQPSAAPYQSPVAEQSTQQTVPVAATTVSSLEQSPQVLEQPMAEAPQSQPLQDAVADYGDATSPTEAPQDQATPSAELPDDDAALLRWEAGEYQHHSRSAVWYVIFAVIAVIAVVLAIVIVKSITFAILIPVMALALIVYVRRAPDVIQYTLSRKGLHVNDKLYTYDTFKAFGIISSPTSHSVVLVPRKRFQIGQTVYFPEEIGEQLVDMLAARLPMNEIAPDAIDRLLAKLHL